MVRSSITNKKEETNRTWKYEEQRKIITFKSEEIAQVEGAHAFPHRKAYLSGEKKLSESGI